MPTFKKFIAILAAILAVVGIIIGLVVTWYSWKLNTPVTDTLVQVLTSAEQVLTVVDNGLTRVDDGLGTALTAVTNVDETVRTAGETIVDTNLAFAVLDRTVGDTLFPKLIEARETAATLAETVVAFNATLEAANRLPFVDVPTLTDELQAIAGRLEEARARAEEIQAELRTIKEEKVARPVTFITDRTTAIAEGLQGAQTGVNEAQTRIDERQERIATQKARLPRLIDLISLAVTLVMLWLIAAQAFVLVKAYEYLTKKKINWPWDATVANAA